MKKVAILGASAEADRYSNMAMKSLLEHGHEVFPVSPKYNKIENYRCYHRLSDIEDPVDVLTMYVGPSISAQLMVEITKLAPKLVIFNPGSENPELYEELDKNGIRYTEACTLVLLSTNQFDSLL